MKRAHIHVLFLLCAICVFGDADNVETVSLKEGDSVTLHTGVTEIKSSEMIEWRFNGPRIAKISDGSSNTYGPIGDRLQLDKLTGDIKITNIKTTDSGEYKLKIRNSQGSPEKTFNVSVVSDDKSLSVLVGEFVTLPTGVTDTKTYDVMRWRFEDQTSPIAEVNRMTGNVSYDGAGEKFKDRLQMDYWTGSLTITSTRNTDSGKYEVDLIKSSKYTIHKSFNVTVRGEIKSVSVKEGESITLNTDSEIQRHDSAMWMFEDNILVSIQNNIINLDPDERFRDRLQLDRHTGSLTIMNTRITDSGDYTQTIRSSKRIIHNKFSVMVNGPGSGSGSGLSAGAVVGICVGVSLFVAFSAAVTYYRRQISELKRKMQEILRQTEPIPLIPHEETLPRTGESEVKWLSVTEGEPVALIPDGNEMHIDDNIQLMFGGTLIAEKKGMNGQFIVHDGRFQGRLHLNKDSGCLIITNIDTSMARDYELRISRQGHESVKKFFVTVYDLK